MPSANPHAELLCPEDVARLSGTDLRVLTWLAWGLDDDAKYKRFSITRRNGSTRLIHAPIKPLKDVQRTLATHFLQAYRRPSHVHGFVTERSPLTNAQIHERKFHVLRVDIEDFFPSISYRRIRGLFRAWPFEYQDKVAVLLARLCCHNDALPQGAPTSPILSNYICRRMDRELAALAAAERCHFSRYADDLSFSTSQHVFPASLGSNDGGVSVAGQALTAIISANGFNVNPAKTYFAGPSQRQRITGLVVNEKVNVPREYIRSLRSLLHIWGRHGRNDAIAAITKHSPPTANRPPGKPPAAFEAIVRGRVQYVASVKGKRNPTYVKLATRLSQVDPGFSVPPPPSIAATLYTEGPSDWRHVLAAQSYFHARGEYEDFQLLTGTEPSKEGDSQLRKFAERQGDGPQSEFVVCLFDSDTRAAKEAVGNDGWRRYGPRTVAVGLVAPEWRNPKSPLFVEQLYEDEVLTTPLENGKRLFLRDEFDHRTGHHRSRSERCSIPGAGSKDLLQLNVYEFDSGKPLAPSKVEFADAIRNSPGRFGEEIFSGFRPTFDRIGLALRDSWEKIE